MLLIDLDMDGIQADREWVLRDALTRLTSSQSRRPTQSTFGARTTTWYRSSHRVVGVPDRRWREPTRRRERGGTYGWRFGAP